MINLDVKAEAWSKLQAQISDDDISEGKRDEHPHVTIMNNINEVVPTGAIEEILKDATPPTIVLDKIGYFSQDDFDVLKFDIASPDLHKLNQAFQGIPHENEFEGGYHPHASICYLKAGMGPKYAGRLTTPLIIKPTKIAYSQPNDELVYYDIGKNVAI
jgi:2'-5' RNA ligase